jgi:hypothetical protein
MPISQNKFYLLTIQNSIIIHAGYVLKYEQKEKGSVVLAIHSPKPTKTSTKNSSESHFFTFIFIFLFSPFFLHMLSLFKKKTIIKYNI